MDVSDDGTLLATGSADKTVKLWGLDFGDCHRSLLAHTDSVMVRTAHTYIHTNIVLRSCLHTCAY
jgi:WD40 repeat protein